MAISLVPMPTRCLLFGGAARSCLSVVFVATIEKQFVGLATLAPTDEHGNDFPCIIALWFKPELRDSEVGVSLLRAAAAESIRQYGGPPRFTALTKDEHVAGRLAVEDGIAIDFQDDPDGSIIRLP